MMPHMGALSWLRRLTSGLVAVGVVTLAGCGEESSSEGSATPEPTVASSPTASGSPTESAGPDLPACDEVWQTGETLRRGYAGCEQDGETVPVDALRCSSGQKFVTFLSSHYAVVGGVVREVEGDIDSDEKYRAAVESCRA